MRARLLCLLLAVACADDEPSRPAAPVPVPADGFLHLLPHGVFLSMRLPPAARVEEEPEVFRLLLRAFGREVSPNAAFFGAEEPEGIDRMQGPGLALAAGGAWVHYLPAKDKSALNRAVRERARELAVREESHWVILSKGGKGAGTFQEAPLPAGDLALRVRHHPLLALVAQPGDTLELGIAVGGGGFNFRGRLRTRPESATRACLAEAHAGEGGLLDYIPSSLALRIETTLPVTPLAGFVTRRLAVHCGLNYADRVLAERFLRETLTGIDPETGIALGLEFREGTASFVALARLGPGPASPILKKLRREGRSSFGALILDQREAPAGLVGWVAWLANAEPQLEGLPQSLWGWVGELADEERGMLFAHARWGKWLIVGGGPRADILVRAVRTKVATGTNRSKGSFALFHLREKGREYVFGAVFAGSGLDGLPPDDRAALAAVLGARPEARAARAIAVAGFRDGDDLSLEGRALY